MSEWDSAVNSYQEQISQLYIVGWKLLSQITTHRARIVSELQKLIHKKDFHRLEFYRDESGAPIQWRDITISNKTVEGLTWKNLTVRGLIFTECRFGAFKIDSCTIFGLRLRECSFEKLTIKDSQIKNSCHLSGLRIAGEFRISDTVFDCDFTLRGSRVGAVTVFNKCEFKSHLGARDCIFEHDFNMMDCVCSLEANFANAVFQRYCRCHRTSFARATYFYYCKFSVPPQFFNAKLNDLTFLTGAEFKRDNRKEDVEAFRTLRSHFSSIKDHEQESRFFALHQRAHRKSSIYIAKFLWLALLMLLRQIDTEYFKYYKGQLLNILPSGRKAMLLFISKNIFNLTVFISYLYDEVSEYGDNFSRSAAWIGVLFFYCYIGYSFSNGVATKVSGNNFFTNIDPGLGFLIQNIFNPLSAISDKAIFFATNKTSFFIYLAQCILELVFSALLLLAVRRKFSKGSSD